jgi:hypothetical protein
LENYFLESKDDPITIIRYLDDLEEELLPDLMSEIPDQDSDLDMELDDEFEEITEVSNLERFANRLIIFCEYSITLLALVFNLSVIAVISTCTI